MRDELLKLREDFFTKANDFEVDFKKFHKEEKRKAKRRGSRDGRRDEPSASSMRYNPVEKEIRHSYATQMAELAIDLSGFLTSVREDHITTLENLLTEIEKKGIAEDIKALQDRRNQELTDVENQYHTTLKALSEDPSLQSLQTEYDDCEDQYEEMCDELDRKNTDASISIPAWLTWIKVIVLGLAEFIVVYLSLLSFEEPPFVTFIWAFVIGIVMSLLGHFAGVLFKRRSWGLKLGAIGLLVLGGLGIYFLSLVRVAGLYEKLSVKEYALPLFLFLGVAVFVVSGIFSYLSHDSDPVFARILKRKKDLSEQIKAKEKELYQQKNGLLQQLQSAQNAIKIKFNQEIENLQTSEDKMQFVLNDAISLYDEMLQGLKNLEHMISRSHDECIEVYRSENSAHRKSKEPAYWQRPYEDLPMTFIYMKELNPDKNQGLWHYHPN